MVVAIVFGGKFLQQGKAGLVIACRQACMARSQVVWPEL
jgi:hypothetical protein